MIVLQSHINIKTFSLNSQVGTARESVVEAKQLSGLFLTHILLIKQLEKATRQPNIGTSAFMEASTS